MKKIVSTAFLLAAAMLLMPLSALPSSGGIAAATTVKGVTYVPKASEAASESFMVCTAETGEVNEIKAEDYIFGVVAAEMPALYDEEALKAQAVAAYTYACVRKAQNSEKSYDITTDNTTDQSYITEEAAREKWGDNADEYIKKIKNAVKEVSGYMITYEGKPITAVYHAISSGKTEDSANVWGKALAYLKPVVSEGDKLAKNYITEASFTLDELKEKFTEESEIDFSAETLFSGISKTDSGTVTQITVGNKTLKGARIRSLLNLRSTCFDIENKDGAYVFTVYGYGHGVGMSQTGADYMAKQGSDFKEILKHYYTGCKVEKI